MHWFGGNDWVLVILAIVVVIVIFLLAPTITRKKKRQKEYLVAIEGTITKVLRDDTDKKGGTHQRVLVHISKVLENQENAKIDLKQKTIVVIRYGDKDGFHQRLRALDRATGKRIEVRGKFIPQNQSLGKDKLPVIHFTHKPIGYIRFDNKTHR